MKELERVRKFSERPPLHRPEGPTSSLLERLEQFGCAFGPRHSTSSGKKGSAF